MSESTKEPIKIWRYRDAPVHLKAMSEHGGDEDYIALVPLHYRDEHLVWRIEDLGLLGCCSTDKHETPEGDVYIGAHS